LFASVIKANAYSDGGEQQAAQKHCTNIPIYKSFQSVKGGIFIFAGSCNSE